MPSREHLYRREEVLDDNINLHKQRLTKKSSRTNRPCSSSQVLSGDLIWIPSLPCCSLFCSKACVAQALVSIRRLRSVLGGIY